MHRQWWWQKKRDDRKSSFGASSHVNHRVPGSQLGHAAQELVLKSSFFIAAKGKEYLNFKSKRLLIDSTINWVSLSLAHRLVSAQSPTKLQKIFNLLSEFARCFPCWFATWASIPRGWCLKRELAEICLKRISLAPPSPKSAVLSLISQIKSHLSSAQSPKA